MSYFTTLFHVTIYSNDIEKTLRFYEKLGIKQIFHLGEEGQVPWNYYLKIAKGQYIEVQPVKGDNPHPIPERAVYYPDQTIWHFALETPDIKAKPVINAQLCTGCGMCGTVCPFKAIR